MRLNVYPIAVLTLCTLINVVLGFKHVWSVLVPYIEFEFKVSRSLAVLPFSLMTITNIIGFMSVDYIKSRLGLKPLLILVAASSIIGLLITSLSPNIYALMTSYAFIYGIGHALGYVLAVSLGVKWFYNKGRGFAAGITSGGYSLGTLVLAPVTSYLITTYGWRQATLFITAITAVVMIPATFILREPEYEVRDSKVYSPVDVLKTEVFYIAWLMIFLTSLVDGFAAAHLAPYITEYVGVDIISASLVVSIYSAINFISRIVMGTLTEYLGICGILIISYTASTINIALFQYYRTLPLMCLGSSVIGLLHGTNVALTPLIASQLWGSKYLGSNYGLLLTAATTSMLVGPLIGSLSYDLTRSYGFAVMILTASSAIGLILLLMFRNLTRKSS